MFNKLYLVHRTHNGKDIYWTQLGNDSKRSVDYRHDAPFDPKYRINAYFNPLVDFTFKNDKEAIAVQRTINSVFKEWTNTPDYKSMQIRIDLVPVDMVNAVTDIINHADDDDYLMNMMKSLHTQLNTKPATFSAGTVYLIECENDKYKIGMTTNLNRRFNDLKEDERYKAIRIVDSFRSKDAAYDEAMLHGLCIRYKRNGNETINWLQGCLNSELYTKCDEVMEIWNKYKETI